ncbi:AsmA family protein [Malonomonas rubra]|uniref:AsmA family protein n=1 Tax=Malonomonas rubra TaxID=57040 RepID=UPI0026F05D44|nr:AsmA family protein [Malonomonas rubra]
MSKTAKIAMAVGITIVFLLVSLSILVKVVVTPERVRGALLPLVEDSLQRKVEVGGIDIGIFSGVSLYDLRVQKKDTPDDFISIKLLALHYKLLPLFRGELVIDQILLEEPRIEIIRTAANEFNFSDLLPTGGNKPATETKTEKVSTGTSPLGLLVNQVSIKGGELVFIDRLNNSRSPYRYLFNQFNFEASRITLNGPFPVEFSTMLDGSQITLSGNYDIAEQAGDLDLQLSKLDLVKFAPYYRQSLPGKLGSAVLNLNLEVQLKKETVESKGKILLDNLDLVLDELPEAALKQGKLELDYALNYQLNRQKLAVSTLLVNFNDAVIGAEGTVELAGKEPNLALALLFDKLDLTTLVDALPDGLNKDIRNFRLAGAIDGRIEFSGPASAGAKLLKTADIELVDVKANLDKLRFGVSGPIKLADQRVEAKQMILDLAGQKAYLEFSAENLFGDLVSGNFRLAADQLDLNPLLPKESEVPQASSPKQAKVKQEQTLAEDIGPFNIPVDMRGTLRVGKLIYRKLDLENVSADVILKDNHLQIEPLRGGVAGGDFTFNSDVDLGVQGLKYQGQASFDQSNLMTLVSGLVPQAKQTVSGLLQLQNNFSGRGTIPDNVLKSLQVKGVLKLRQGQVTGSPLLEQLAMFLDLPDLKILSFDALESNYDLRNGLTKLSAQLDSSKAKLKPEGTISVEGGLDLKLDARLSPDLMNRIGVKTGLQKELSDKDGWGMLPLTIKGTLSSPKIGLDSKVLQERATSKVKQEATKRLLEKVVPADEEKTPVKQLLEGTLNRLLGN